MPSQPPSPYERNFDFEQFSQQTPNAQQPGQEINQELDEIQASLNETISRLGEIQRDDGKLRTEAWPGNDIDQQIAAAEAARNESEAARAEAEAARDECVTSANAVQSIATNQLQAAQAAVDAADAAALQAQGSAGVAEVSANNAVSQAAAASASALSASTSAGTATTQAGLATTAKNNAQASATAASNSADTAQEYSVEASNSAFAAAASAVEAEASAQSAEAAAASINPSAYIPQPAVAPVADQILGFDGTAWVAQDNFATVLQESVRNETGAVLNKGTVVYLNGVSGNKPLAVKSQANTEATSSKTFGVIAANIADNNNGYVVTSGLLKGLDTLGYTAGSAIWLSPTTPGGFTQTKPTAPNHAVLVGYVVRVHQTQGEILVRVANGLELEELHNVSAQNPDDGYVLSFDAALGVWKPVPRNPFNQDLGTTAAPSFESLSLTSGGIYGPLFYEQAGSNQVKAEINGVSTELKATDDNFTTYAALTGQGVRFPDATTQTTAVVSTPDASTTVKGKVELATDAEAVDGANNTMAVTPAGLLAKVNSPNRISLSVAAFGSGTSGTGASAGQNGNQRSAGAPTSAVGYGMLQYNLVMPCRGVAYNGGINWAKRHVFSFLISKGINTSDPNTVGRVVYGKPTFSLVGGAPTTRSVGIDFTGNGVVALIVHNGTTLTRVNGSPSQSTTSTFAREYRIVSDNGTVTLYQDDVQVATTNAGPTGSSQMGINIEAQNLAIITGTAMAFTTANHTLEITP